MIVSAPDLTIVRGKAGQFALATGMRYVWSEKACVVDVPAGTVTDLASIPRGLRNVININGNHRLPAILHDYLYAQAGQLVGAQLIGTGGTTTITYSRKDADREFYTAMRLEGVRRITAWAMYRAVRLFGGLHLKITGGRTWK